MDFEKVIPFTRLKPAGPVMYGGRSALLEGLDFFEGLLRPLQTLLRKEAGFARFPR